MTEIITGKARIEQIKSRLWKTLDNQLVKLDNGRLLIAPRYLVTDNNSNPFGDNDMSDVRASHFHDIGCAYHQLIYVNKNIDLEDLQKTGFLHHIYKKDDDTNFVMVLENLPLDWLEIKPCKYSEVNRIFKEILKASGEKKFKTNLMYWAVWHNLKWFLDKPEGINRFDLFKKEYGNIK